MLTKTAGQQPGSSVFPTKHVGIRRHIGRAWGGPGPGDKTKGYVFEGGKERTLGNEVARIEKDELLCLFSVTFLCLWTSFLFKL